MSRYQVQSDHVRGEKRAYWVMDGRGNCVSEVTNDRRTAEHWCFKLQERERLEREQKGK